MHATGVPRRVCCPKTSVPTVAPEPIIVIRPPHTGAAEIAALKGPASSQFSSDPYPVKEARQRQQARKHFFVRQTAVCGAHKGVHRQYVFGFMAAVWPLLWRSYESTVSGAAVAAFSGQSEWNDSLNAYSLWEEVPGASRCRAEGSITNNECYNKFDEC